MRCSPPAVPAVACGLNYAVFGEASYDLTDRLKATAGARYYDFKETRKFLSGGLFSNGDNRSDKISSNGVSPRSAADLRDYGAQVVLSHSSGASRHSAGSVACRARHRARIASLVSRLPSWLQPGSRHR